MIIPPEVITARSIALAHTILYNGGSYFFVKTYLAHTPEESRKLKGLSGAYTKSWVIRAKFCALVAVFVSAPYIYAHTAMPDPCDFAHMTLLRGGRTSAVELAHTDCRVEDFMRSWWALCICPLAALLFSLLWCCLRCLMLYGFTKHKKFQNWIRGQLMNGFRPHLRTLQYIPTGETPVASYMNQGVSFSCVMVLSYMLLGLLMGSSVGLIVGMALARALIAAMNALLSPGEIAIAQIEGLLDKWRAPGLWTRLRSTQSTVIYVSKAEFKAVESLEILKEEVLGLRAEVKMHERYTSKAIQETLSSGDQCYWRDVCLAKAVVVVDPEGQTCQSHLIETVIVDKSDDKEGITKPFLP